MLTRYTTKELRQLEVYSLPSSRKPRLLVPQGKRKLENCDMIFPNFGWELLLTTVHNPLPKFLSHLTTKTWGRVMVQTECSSIVVLCCLWSLETFMLHSNISANTPAKKLKETVGGTKSNVISDCLTKWNSFDF